MVNFQHTLQTSIDCVGPGIHTGKTAHLRILPAEENSGIRFKRTDISTDISEPDAAIIQAHAANISESQFRTKLTNKAGYSVATTEHLLAACAGMGLDNLLIEIDQEEIPILDGSSAIFCNLIRDAGLRPQRAARKILHVRKPVTVRSGQSWARLEPSEDQFLTLTARIEFEDEAIGLQAASVCLTPGAFHQDIAFARTFGFLHEFETLKKNGYARGGSLENAIVVDAGQIMNADGLRCPDEFIRHKLLDAAGDLALAGYRIAGSYKAERPSHTLNHALVKKLMADTQGWSLENDRSVLQTLSLKYA